jgi:hypothetical protein
VAKSMPGRSSVEPSEDVMARRACPTPWDTKFTFIHVQSDPSHSFSQETRHEKQPGAMPAARMAN